MSTLKVNTILNAAGTGTPAIDGLAKAWVNFNGTGTVAIRAAYNVSSITDNGTGDYSINFTSPMADINYSLAGSASRASSANTSFVMTLDADFSTSSARIITNTGGGTSIDSVKTSVAIFR